MLALGDNPPQTYIIAQNPTVLAQLMRENENRPINPSAYTTPASVFNTLAVDIDSSKNETSISDAPILPLKTVILPASEILKLNPIIDENTTINHIASDNDSEHTNNRKPAINNNNRLDISQTENNAQITSPNFIQSNTNSPNHQSSTIFPIPCETINTQTQNIVHSFDPMYKTIQATANVTIEAQQQQQNLGIQSQHLPNNVIYSSSGATFFQQNACQNVPYSPNLPPHSETSQKSRSLERNTPSNVIYASRISSLDRIQNSNQFKQTRSNSLTRQLSSGNDVASSIHNNADINYYTNARSASLERSARFGIGAYGCRTNSLERNNPILQQQQQNELMTADAMHRGGSLERNQSIASTYNILKNRAYRGGSLERNPQSIAIVNRSVSLERNAQYQMQQDPFKSNTTKETEPFQEEIYDFGGANVKSCASIALSKSISKGLIPAGTILPSTSQSYPSTYSIQSMKIQSKSPNFPPTHNTNPNAGHIMQSYNYPHMQNPDQSIQQQSIDSPFALRHTAMPQPSFTTNSIYTPMYPLMWSNQTTQLQTAQKVAQTTPQLTQVPIPFNVSNSSLNVMLQSNQCVSMASSMNPVQDSITEQAQNIDNNGFIAQV